MAEPFRIITVCTGNICRSPLAQYMVEEAARQAGLDIVVDSAGTTNWEIGNPIDPRAGALLTAQGIDSSGHRARRFVPDWFFDRDLILALDVEHYETLRALATNDDDAAKVRMMRSFDPAVADKPVAEQGIYDPWFGDERDFEASRQLIAAAIPGILDHVRNHARH